MKSHITIFGIFCCFLFSYNLQGQTPSPAQQAINEQSKNDYSGWLQTKINDYKEKKKDKTKNQKDNDKGEKDDPESRIFNEFISTVDPATKTIPYERLQNARDVVDKTIKQKKSGRLNNGLLWNERGPNNIGGRTRALMFDPNDVTKKKMWAGGVGGGLWYKSMFKIQM